MYCAKKRIRQKINELGVQNKHKLDTCFLSSKLLPHKHCEEEIGTRYNHMWIVSKCLCRHSITVSFSARSESSDKKVFCFTDLNFLWIFGIFCTCRRHSRRTSNRTFHRIAHVFLMYRLTRECLTGRNTSGMDEC